MKLIRSGPVQKERPAVLLHDQTRIDVSQCTADYDEAFFAHNGIARLEQWLRQHASSAPRLNSSERLGPPISRPGKIICVGLNYRAHAAESKLALPGEPVLFSKATSSVAGANDCVVMPRGGEKLDYEVELAVVIGKKAAVSHANALSSMLPATFWPMTIPSAAFNLSAGASGSRARAATVLRLWVRS